MALSKWPEIEEKMPLIESWTRDGLIEKDICHNLGISVQTLNVYKHKYPELRESLKKNKEIIDITVVNALYKRTQGYRYDEVTTERVPIYEDGTITGYEMQETKRVTKEVLPDPTSMIFWLKNRCRDAWRDKREVENTMEVRVPMIDEVKNTFAKARQIHNIDAVDVVDVDAIEDVVYE